MGREIRRVPANWKHPHNIDEHKDEVQLRPMYQGDFDEHYKEWQKELAEWFEGYKLWHEHGKYKGYKGEVKSIEDCVRQEVERWNREGLTNYHSAELALSKTGELGYEWYSGRPPSPPSPNDYMPHGNWYQLYENVSEGTPLSPPFKTKKQLVDWLSNNKDFWGHTWSPEQAEAMVKSEYAPSAVFSNGKVYTAEESTLL